MRVNPEVDTHRAKAAVHLEPALSRSIPPGRLAHRPRNNRDKRISTEAKGTIHVMIHTGVIQLL